jgi:lipid-A-disaccharide synthase
VADRLRVMISCGEPSGDLYAGALAAEIRALAPDARLSGFGGDRLAAAGASLTANFAGLSVTGLAEALRVLPRSWRIYRQLVRAAEDERPDVFVPIDFPDFNLILARALKRRGIPVVYYISPQLWAWRPGRVKTIKRVVDRVLVIFPFETAFYESAGVPSTFVGHPLLEAPPAEPRERFLPSRGLDPAQPVVALLPGSRRNEVRQLLPDMVRAAGMIAAEFPRTQFLIPRAPHLDDALFAPLETWPSGAQRPVVVEHAADAVLAAADVAIVASGTATVQAALHGCPMVVVYRVAPLTYRLGKPLVKVQTYAMANLIAGRRVVPELIQEDFTPEAAAGEALKVLRDPAHAARVRADLAEVRARLGDAGASRRAAEAVLDAARAARARAVARG